MVNIERKKNKMSFTKGWLEFVAHYRLMEGDFVTFEHTGEMQFNVRIFGNTACEKPLQPPLKEEVPLLPYPTSANSHRLAKRSRGKQCYTNSLPYFSKRMTESYFKSFPRIQIPIDFAEQHGLFELPRKAVLKDELGNRHIVNVSCSSEETQKRIRLGCGMTTFFNTNNVKVGDDCIFELDLNAKQHNQLIFNVAILKHRNGSNIYKHWGIGL
ncbi:hypothetical protein Syun_020485 [Stephania yunnanensis]|uniref:TF-B3 domain-containing protein n=1 Tax=Stephania yunnanensis TaxID=152371 RepID=A0AAP0IEP5_9MAGN